MKQPMTRTTRRGEWAVDTLAVVGRVAMRLQSFIFPGGDSEIQIYVEISVVFFRRRF